MTPRGMQSDQLTIVLGDSSLPMIYGGVLHCSNTFDQNQKKTAEKVLTDVNDRLSGKVVTKISLLKNYCPAEEYHQNYYKQNKTAGYCRAVISPKVTKARKKLSRYY